MINIGGGLVEVPLKWPAFKAILASKHLAIQHSADTDFYHLFAIDDSVIYTAFLYNGDITDGLGFSQEDNDSWLSEFESSFLSISNKRIEPPRTESGFVKSQPEIREGNKTQIISQNFCDRTTWFHTSERRTGIAMVDSGDGYTWNLPDGYEYMVDLCHGKILHERRLRETYRAKVYVDGYQVSEKDPHDNVGDWLADYTTGSVTFDLSRQGSVVTIDYSRVVNSRWIVKASTGKKLRIASAELQFSTDTRMNDTFVFQVYADVAKFPYFLPHCTTHGGPFPPGTKLPVGDATYYQTILDLLCESNLAYPPIPKWQGLGATWRDLKSDFLIFSWDYEHQASIDMRDDWGIEIEIRLEHDVACGGSAAIITFYCTSEDL